MAILFTIALVAIASISLVTAQTYKEVTTITGAGDQSSSYFELGKEARYTWSYTAKNDFAAFYVYLYKQGSDFPVKTLMASDQTSGTEYLHNLSPGKYYLDISAANLESYKITVEEQQSNSNPTATAPAASNPPSSSGSDSDGGFPTGLLIVALIVVVAVIVVVVKVRGKK